jgi:hypothetical protein
MSRAAVLLGAVLAIPLIVLDAPRAAAQELRIGIIDFYGLHQVAESQVRAVLGFAEGDMIRSGDDARAAAERRLGQLPGVVRARLNAVCCDAGRAILYVGIEEQGAATLQFRTAPAGTVRLPDDVVRAGNEFERALMAAVQRGDAKEDDADGHSLMHDPAARAIQERFIRFAARDRTLIHDVVRESADAAHRALAAQILGYAADKRAVIEDLAFGMSDPSESVRNNAMRALALIAGYAARMPDRGIRVSFAPFVNLLNSPVWTDRNKASFALEELSGDRDPELLATLRARALPALIEMVRWKSEGHVGAAFFLLGRVGGLSEAEIQAAWARRDREFVIRAASAGR